MDTAYKLCKAHYIAMSALREAIDAGEDGNRSISEVEKFSMDKAAGVTHANYKTYVVIEKVADQQL